MALAFHLKPSLRTTVVFSLTAIMLAAVLLISVVVLRVIRQSIMDEKLAGANLVSQSVAAGIRGVLTLSEQLTASEELSMAQDILVDLAHSEELSHVVVVDRSRMVLAAIGPWSPGTPLSDPLIWETMEGGVGLRKIQEEGSEIFLRVYQPVFLGGTAVAAVRLTFPLNAIRSRMDVVQQLLLFFIIIDALVLLLFGSFLLDRLIVRPLRTISKATWQVSQGALDQRLDVKSGNEIGQLSASFNQMVESLAHNRERLQEKISELEQVNRQMEQARDSMVRSEKLASVGTLAAGVAHEVGNPLSAILGYIDILLDGDCDSDEVTEILKRLRVQVLRIHRTIRELLDYSRPSRTENPLCRPNEVVEATVRLLAPHPKLHHIELDSRLTSDLPPAAIEASLLQQVLVNLILNAADATPDPSQVILETGLHAENSKLVLKVTDHGSGIPEDQLGRIFDPFYTTKDPGEGTGLGLSICHRILEDHNGSIQVANNPEIGCTFRVFLAAVDAPVQHQDGEHGEAVTSMPGKVRSPQCTTPMGHTRKATES